MNKEINTILYHGNCPDGFCAAWAAWCQLGDNATYIPVCHGDKHPDEIVDKHVALVDFCYPRAEMEKLSSVVKSLTVVDHHISAMKEMEGFEPAELNFDMTRSGCVLSWRYFNKDKAIPRLLLAVEARDLWKPYWQEIYGLFLSGLDSYEYKDFNKLNELVLETEISTSDSPCLFSETRLAKEGKHIDRFRKELIRYHVKRAVNAKILGHSAKIVNCSSKELISDIGNELCSDSVIGVAWWFDHRVNRAVVSFRSNKIIDVSVIAKYFKGGGHVGAAGASVPLSLIESWTKFV